MPHNKHFIYSVYAFFLILAIGFQWYIFKHDASSFHIVLSGDGGNITSFIAGWLYPERFADDLVLNNTDNFAFYLSGSIPFTLLFHLGFGFDIGTAFSLAYAPIIFIQLVGFFILGQKLFKNDLFALALSLLTMVCVHIGAGEHWAILHEPISRQWHNAFLPFMLLALVSWTDKPNRWFWLFALAGLSVYLHPVGAPAFAFITGFVILCTKPRSFSWPEHIIKLGFSALAFFVVAGPFIYLYLSSFPALEATGSAKNIGTHIYEHVRVANTHAWIAFQQFFLPSHELALGESFWQNWFTHNVTGVKRLSNFVENNWSLFSLIGGLAGYIFAYKKAGKEGNSLTQKHVLFFLKISAAIFIVSILLPWLDQMVAKASDRNPLQYDLARNFRFLIPILYIGVIYFFVSKPFKHALKLCFFCILVGLYFSGPVMMNFAVKEASKNYVPKIFDIHKESSKHLTYLKSLPPQRILPIGYSWSIQRDSLALRYIAYQPVVYTPKDRNALAYSNSPRYWRWIDLREHYKKVMSTNIKDSEKENELSQLIAKTNPTYLYIDRDVHKGWLEKAALKYGNAVLETPHKMLIKIDPDQ